MRRSSVVLGVGVALALLASRGQSHAGALEGLVMPGPVSAAHAKLEGDCTKCHAPLHPEQQNDLCRSCHEDVAKDQAGHLGFHGKAPSATGTACRTCHTEHKGRDADIVGLERETFRHALTDFPLSGAHAQVPCSGCHASGKPWREAPSTCSACHASEDPHHGAMGTDCGACHSEGAWSGARFDHAKTRFPLDGKHTEVACAVCHPSERYSGTPRDCVGCHSVNDVHHGSLGTSCESCHTAITWKKVRFDHARETRFPLTGRHASVACEACHVGGVRATKLASDCLSCHRADDTHRGRNGNRCEECHTTVAWKPATFDHARETRFPLRGAHRELACATCHTGTLHQQRLGTDCASCHARDDVHRGSQGTACGKCHGEVAWRERVRFDHDLTRFPLLGLHATVACEECHVSRSYSGTDSRCIACHAKDDSHRRALGPGCEACHNPNAWAAWRFDHDAQTGFALHGGHARLDCLACHRSAVDGRPTLRKDCIACHGLDDRHNGAFGTDCARCHTDETWREVRLRR